jgi:type I restriction enzyme S subunit
MNPDLLLTHFDRISEAADAIPRLRRFILDLAVRGKLVEQNPKDEPASELIKRILQEKKRFGEANNSKPNSLPPIELGEIPFEVPLSWAWIRVGTGFQYDAGIKRQPRELQPIKWLLELEDIEKDTSVVLTRLKVQDRNSLSTKSEFMEGDILYGKLRPYLNKVVIADVDGYSTTEIVAIRPFIQMNPSYCSLAFRRPDFVEYVSRVGQGTKMPRLRTQDALVALFPLPPLAEQRRISAKVEELMVLCDRLETTRCERDKQRNRLTAACHYHLSYGSRTDAGRDRATFYINHLQTVTYRADQIPVLRQTILDLAVRGLLVPPDPGDEPASFLAKRLAAERGEYARDHNMNVSKVTSIAEQELPGPAPKGWEWVRLANMFNVITDGDHQPPPKSDRGVAFLTIGNITTGRLNFSNCRFVPQSYIDNLPEYRKPSAGDILYTVVGATFGRPAFVDTTRPFCVQRHVAILKPAQAMNVRFLTLMLASSLIYDQAKRSVTGTAQPTIPLRPLRDFLALLPPIAEQERIVAKVEELLTVCDQLEASLRTAEKQSLRLLDSALYQSLHVDAVAQEQLSA